MKMIKPKKISSYLRLLSAAVLSAAATTPAAANNFRYLLPADMVDFSSGSPSQTALEDLWDTNMDTFTKQGKVTNPWTEDYNTGFTNYIDPKEYAYPTNAEYQNGTVIQPITWSALPNRVIWYFNTSQNNPYQIPRDLLYPLIDQGRFYRYGDSTPIAKALNSWVSLIDQQNGGLSLRIFLTKLADSQYNFFSQDLSSFSPVSVPIKIYPTVEWEQANSDWEAFGPPGPRGWKDEYNEWVVTRDESGKITKINFTAENPEYWFTMWKVDPNKVLALYRELVSPKVVLEDL